MKLEKNQRGKMHIHPAHTKGGGTLSAEGKKRWKDKGPDIVECDTQPADSQEKGSRRDGWQDTRTDRRYRETYNCSAKKKKEEKTKGTNRNSCE